MESHHIRRRREYVIHTFLDSRPSRFPTPGKFKAKCDPDKRIEQLLARESKIFEEIVKIHKREIELSRALEAVRDIVDTDICKVYKVWQQLNNDYPPEQ